ncbi:MAG: hypothetical protein GC150_06580 [Rhizobiales bacterium]|nr:hypothetical protein [Hyphomicrobiales bacterium]
MVKAVVEQVRWRGGSGRTCQFLVMLALLTAAAIGGPGEAEASAVVSAPDAPVVAQYGTGRVAAGEGVETADEEGDEAFQEDDASPSDAFFDDVRLVDLTPAYIEAFILARPKMMAVVMGAVEADEGSNAAPVLADADNERRLEEIAREAGFESFAHMIEVENTIGLYFTAIDPATGEFTDPRDKLREQMEEVSKEPGIDEEARKELIEIYEDMLSTQPALDNAENIRLVREYYERILEAARQ